MKTMKKLVVIILALVFCGNLPGSNAFRVFEDVDGTETILAFPNELIKIKCKTDLPMTYCGFLNPRGKRYSGGNNGQCFVDIKATTGDDGEWKCHIGMKSVRVETIKKIRVRVVNQVAAIHPNTTAMHGKPVTLHCATTKGFVPISYCRFEPPKGSPFNIDATVTSENPILGKYFYPQNRSLDRGDCAVTIRKVKYDDVGVWTCGAGLDGNEYTDVIRIDVQGLYTLSTASATGVTLFGILLAIALALLGYIAWKKRGLLGARNAEPEVIDIQELGPMPARRSRTPSPQARRATPYITVQPPTPVQHSQAEALPLM